jgi:hypothetical protein
LLPYRPGPAQQEDDAGHGVVTRTTPETMTKEIWVYLLSYNPHRYTQFDALPSFPHGVPESRCQRRLSGPMSLPGRAAGYPAAPPQTRTSAIDASGSSVSRVRYVNRVDDPGDREGVTTQ